MKRPKNKPTSCCSPGEARGAARQQRPGRPWVPAMFLMPASQGTKNNTANFGCAAVGYRQLLEHQKATKAPSMRWPANSPSGAASRQQHSGQRQIYGVDQLTNCSSAVSSSGTGPVQRHPPTPFPSRLLSSHNQKVGRQTVRTAAQQADVVIGGKQGHTALRQGARSPAKELPRSGDEQQIFIFRSSLYPFFVTYKSSANLVTKKLKHWPTRQH